MSELPEVVEDYLDALSCRLARTLDKNLIGTYVHGSATLGGFNPDRSDIDVLVVVEHSLSRKDREELKVQLDVRSLPVPASTLEMSIVTIDTTQTPTSAPSYEMHVNTSDARFANGQGRTDPDLVLHFPVVRQCGRLLGHGSPPDAVFAPVPRSLVLRAMAEELVDALGGCSATPEYMLLNACRNLAYMNDNRFYSKIDGGRWVLDHDSTVDARLVTAALHRQAGSHPTTEIDATAMSAVVGRITRQLTDAAARSERHRG